MLRTLVRVASAAALIGGLNVALVTPAEAVPPVSPLRRCSFASVTDPTIEDGETQTGQINGGPITSTTPGATVEMTCTIQVGAENHAHSGADACSVTSMPAPVTTVPATLCSYVSPDGQPVYMCTHVIVNGVSWYWDSTGSNATTTPLDGVVFTGEWSTDPSATCDEAIQQEIFPGPFEPVLDLLDHLFITVLDPIICPELAARSGVYGPIYIAPSGDVYIDDEVPADGWQHPDDLWFDCPPYTFVPEG